MAKHDVLKHVFQGENWDSINKADDYMANSRLKSTQPQPPKKEESSPTQTTLQGTNDDSRIITGLKDEISQFRKKQIEINSSTNSNINEIAKKINELILNQNRIESSIKALEDKIEKMTKSAQKESIGVQTTFGQNAKSENNIIDRPIDRNNVAPSDVQIGKIFNFSNKKF